MSERDFTRVNQRVKDLSGMTFGRLDVISRSGSNKHGKATWICRCNCGKLAVVVGSSLLSGRSTSCKHHAACKHGHAKEKSKTRTYYAWSSMKKRCKEVSSDHKNYYDRGISVCERWNKFENFLSDMGECPDGYEIDRIDNNNGYSKDNCRWANESVQRRNQRKSIMYEADGKRMLLIDWAVHINIPYNTLIQRMRRGKWSFEKAIRTPNRLVTQ